MSMIWAGKENAGNENPVSMIKDLDIDNKSFFIRTQTKIEINFQKMYYLDLRFAMSYLICFNYKTFR